MISCEIYDAQFLDMTTGVSLILKCGCLYFCLFKGRCSLLCRGWVNAWLRWYTWSLQLHAPNLCQRSRSRYLKTFWNQPKTIPTNWRVIYYLTFEQNDTVVILAHYHSALFCCQTADSEEAKSLRKLCFMHMKPLVSCNTKQQSSVNCNQPKAWFLYAQFTYICHTGRDMLSIIINYIKHIDLKNIYYLNIKMWNIQLIT